MTVHGEMVLAQLSGGSDPWLAWRARRLLGEEPGPVPEVSDQDELGSFTGPTGRLSPGATGAAICHLCAIGMRDSGPAAVAADWLEEARTPAGAWLDAPDDVPGDVTSPAAGRVWATASAACALLAVGRSPGPRCLVLLRGEADQDGSFTGGFYPTVAAAGAFWLAEGQKTETAEWALRWARENEPEGDMHALIAALRFWSAAGIPPEHASVELFTDALRLAVADAVGIGDPALSLDALELLSVSGG